MLLSPMYTATMTDQQRQWFYAEYQAASKDEVVGVLLAFFLGVFGIHKFYLGQTGWGVVYILFSWTGIPAIVGLIECFLMPGRVRAYNAAQAQYIASGILASSPPPAYSGSVPPPPSASVGLTPQLTPQMCSACGSSVPTGAAFCAKCGAAIAA